VGASTREFVVPNAQPADSLDDERTRAILAAAEACDEVLIGSLLNLRALTEMLQSRGEDVTILCAGYKGAFAFDDAFCAGRIAAELGGEPTDAALAARMLAERYPDPRRG